MHAGPGSLSEGGRGGRPSSAKPWGERQQLASRPQGSRRRAPARPGRAAAARGEARSRQTEQSGRLAGRPPGGGFAAVWRFCHISDSQKGRGGRTQLFLAETVFPGGLGALRPDPGLPVTGASPGPSGQLGLSEGPARSWLPSLHLALGLSSGPRPRASGRGGSGGGHAVLSRKAACHLPGETLLARGKLLPSEGTVRLSPRVSPAPGAPSAGSSQHWCSQTSCRPSPRKRSQTPKKVAAKPPYTFSYCKLVN